MSNETILVVAAHPDDEILGCGGTICHHLANQDEVVVLFISEGVSARSVPGQLKDWTLEIERREHAAFAVAQYLGCRPPKFLRRPNLRIRDTPMLDLVKEIEAAIEDIRPTSIYTHHSGDLNSDHRLTHEAVITATRPLPTQSVRAIYAFETPSSTEWSSLGIGPAFVPMRFVNIADHMDKKIEALALYEFELRPFPHPRSREAITALARSHGSRIGCLAAEAFIVIREIVGKETS